MVASVLIIIVSAALFGYWLRYTCILILQTSPARDYTREVATENGLSFIQLREQVRSSADMDALEIALQKDYRVVTHLLRQAAALTMAGVTLEHVVLRTDFWLMQTFYRVSRRFSQAKARAALDEMCQIVDHLANAFGAQMMAAPTIEQN